MAYSFTKRDDGQYESAPFAVALSTALHFEFPDGDKKNKVYIYRCSTGSEGNYALAYSGDAIGEVYERTLIGGVEGMFCKVVVDGDEPSTGVTVLNS